MNQQIRFCTAADGTRLAYSKVGAGFPLVKVANWLSHLEHDWNSPVWRPWLEEFSRFHTLYRYDQRGCGLSDWNVPDLSFESLVGDLESVVDAAGLEAFVLFAMSQGGSVAIAYAARHPERVSRLIISGGYLRGQRRRNPGPQQLKAIELELDLLGLSWGQENPAYRQVITSFLIPEATPEQFAWFNNLQLVSTSPENAVRLQQTFNEVDVYELAANIRTPTLIIHARKDAAVGFENGRQAASQIPGARLVILESRNHVLLAAEPAWAQFWEELNRFTRADGQSLRSPSGVEAEQPAGRLPGELTAREHDILRMLARGYQNDEIAARLVLSPKTVRNYVSNLYSKLQVKNRREAIHWYERGGEPRATGNNT